MAFDLGTAIGYLDLDTTNWNKNLNAAKENMQQFFGEGQSFSNRINSVGLSLTVLGRAATPASVAVAGIGAAALKVTADFTAVMSKVQAISGATAEQMEMLESKAKELGASTKYSATEVGEAFTYMGMAGWKTQDMLDGIASMLDLAAASGEDLATTSDIITDALTAFGLQAADTAEFCDVLASAATNSNTNVGMMGYTFKYAAPLAGALGYSINDVAIAAGLMANAGIKSETAGTQLRTMFSSLTGQIELSGEKLGKYVLDMENADGSVVPFRETLVSLREAFGEMTESEQLANAESLVGKEAMSGLLAIVNASESDFNNLANAIDNSSGKAAEMSAIMQDNLQGDLIILKSALEGAGLVIGEQLEPAARKFIQTLTNLVTNFNELNPETQKFIIKLGAIVVATAPVLLAGGKLLTLGTSTIGMVVKLVPIIRTLITVIAGLSNPFTIAIAAALAFVAAYQNNLFGLKDATNKTIGMIKTAWNNFVTQAPQLGRMLIDGLVNGITGGIGAVGTAITNLGNSLISKMKSVLDIHSPSKKAAMIGQYWDLGLAEGIKDNAFVVNEGLDYLNTMLENAGDSIQETFVASVTKGNNQVYSKIYDNSMKVISVYEKERNKRVSLMTKGTDENVAQIKREISATENAYKIKMRLYEQEYNARVKMVDTGLTAELEELQKEIDAISAQSEQEERQEKEEEFQKKLAEKEKELELEKDTAKQKEISQEIDELIADRQKELIKQQRSDRQEELRAQMEEARKRAEEEKAALQEEYEAKQYQLQMQREAEIQYMTQMQELLEKDLELRKELAETQKEIAEQQEKLKTKSLSKESKTQTQNEITELKKREQEIKNSLSKNENTFKAQTPKLQSIGEQYGSVLTNGILQYEDTIDNFFTRLLDKASEVISSMKEAADLAGDSGISTYSASQRVVQQKVVAGTQTGGNTYNFYSNEKMTAAEISRQFKKTEKDLALGF